MVTTVDPVLWYCIHEPFRMVYLIFLVSIGDLSIDQYSDNLDVVWRIYDLSYYVRFVTVRWF